LTALIARYVMPGDPTTEDDLTVKRERSDPVPEADALEQSQPVEVRDEGDGVASDEAEVPEADALEQSQPVEVRDGEDGVPSDEAEVPEADALEQSRVAPLDDDR
jgi:hypothetical protein